jgi:NCS1 family nucleobase:cation symporter-1
MSDTKNRADASRNNIRRGIESRSIDYVPLSERHGRVVHQGPFWFAGNFNFFTVAIGFIGPAHGLSFAATCVASILGILFGTVFMAFHASQGPDLGLPQMIQSRAQFGYRGVIVPLLGTLFTFVGFNVVDTVLIGQGLDSLFGWSVSCVSIILALGAAALAIYGHDWLHFAFRILFWVGLPFYAILSVAIINGTIVPQPIGALMFTWAAFAAQFAACVSYNITFAPYVSDYTRYLPPQQFRSRLVWGVYLGASLSSIWLIVLGAWLATYFGASDGMASTNAAGNLVLPHFGTLTVLVSVAALIAAMGLNAYSGMLTILTGIDSIVKIQPTQTLRVTGVLVLTAFWLAVSLVLTGNAIDQLYNCLSIMLYLLVPWTAVNLVDYFFVRKGRYAIADLFTSNGIYRAWGWRGLTSYSIGLLCSVPFFNLPGTFEGPIANALGDVDISWLPGLLVSALAYFLLARNLNLEIERRAIEASNSLLDIASTST